MNQRTVSGIGRKNWATIILLGLAGQTWHILPSWKQLKPLIARACAQQYIPRLPTEINGLMTYDRAAIKIGKQR